MITIKNIFQWVISCILYVLLFTSVWFAQSSLKKVNIDLELLDYEHLRHNDLQIFTEYTVHPYLKKLNPLELHTKPWKWYLGDNKTLMKKTWGIDTSYWPSPSSINIRKEVIWADPHTYQLLQDWYAIDKNYVFYNDSLLTGSNSASFTYLWLWFAKDKNYVYINWSLLTWADSTTFDLSDDVKTLVKSLKIDIIDKMSIKNKIMQILIVAKDINNKYNLNGDIITDEDITYIYLSNNKLQWTWNGSIEYYDSYFNKVSSFDVTLQIIQNVIKRNGWCNLSYSYMNFIDNNKINIFYNWMTLQKGCVYPPATEDYLIWTHSIKFINDDNFILKNDRERYGFEVILTREWKKAVTIPVKKIWIRYYRNILITKIEKRFGN